MRSASANTASMSCSTSRMVSSFFSSRSIVDHAGGLLRAEAGHRLVEQQHARVAGERHGHFELPVLAVARADAGKVSRALKADAGERRARRFAQFRFAARVAPEMEGMSGMRLYRQRDIVEHGRSRNNEVIWNERASPRRLRLCIGSAEMSWPSKRMRPAFGVNWPDSCAISVVLPAPFGPMMACNSPCAMPSVDVVGGDDAAEALGETFGLQQRFSHGAPCRAGRRCRHGRTARPAATAGQG